MFRKKLGNKGLVGLDIGSSSVKAVELTGKPGSLSLVNLGFEGLQPDTVVDGQIMELNDVSGVISGVFSQHQFKTDRVAAGVSGSSVIVKNIIVPQMTREELEGSIDWHAEEHIPFEISDVSLDYQVVGSGSDSLHVLMAACKRDFVANLKQAIQLAGKQPAVIDVDAFALQNCYEVNYQPAANLVVALLNVGASTMNINILRGVRSVFTRDVSVGGNQYTSVLQKELGLTYEQAEAVKRGGEAPANVQAAAVEGALESVSDMLALEISKTFDFYRATADDNDGSVQRILISGGGSKLKGLPEFLSSRFEMPVERLDPFRLIKVDARRFDPEYMREVVPEMAVAVGLALRGLDGHAGMIKVNLLDSVTERHQSSAAIVEERVANPAARFWMLGASVLGLLVLAMVFDFYSASASQKKAKAELEKQQQIAAQMAAVNKEQADLEKKLKDIQSRIDVIKKLRSSQQGPVALLSDLNSRLPADPHFRLNAIEQKGGELTIEGQSPNEYSVTQFGRSLEFSDGLFLNVSMEAERKEAPLNQADYTAADGPIDPNFRPEIFTFKIKCKYGPSQAPAPAEGAKGGKKK